MDGWWTDLVRLQERTGGRDLRVMVADQMSEDLGVGCRTKLVSGLDQPFLDPVEILDHAVVDDGDSAALIEVRVGVLVGRRSVSGPTRVSDSQMAGDGPGVQKLAETFVDFALFLACLELDAVEHAHPGPVVTAVFETPQPAQEDEGY